MERRDFFRAMLGAAALLPPSQVWPFRKIFIPSWLYQPAFTVTTAHPNFVMRGDRVKIYRTAQGLDGVYFVVDEIDNIGNTITFRMAKENFPLPDWVSKGETLWSKER